MNNRDQKLASRVDWPIAAGTGFHSVRLTGAGFNVTSVDGNAAMLAKAFANAQSRGLILKTVQTDWRWLNRDINGKFDTIPDTVEAGLVLTGSEVKSLRHGLVQLADAFARYQHGEMWLEGSTSRPTPTPRASAHTIRSGAANCSSTAIRSIASTPASPRSGWRSCHATCTSKLGRRRKHGA